MYWTGILLCSRNKFFLVMEYLVNLCLRSARPLATVPHQMEELKGLGSWYLPVLVVGVAQSGPNGGFPKQSTMGPKKGKCPRSCLCLHSPLASRSGPSRGLETCKTVRVVKDKEILRNDSRLKETKETASHR